MTDKKTSPRILLRRIRTAKEIASAMEKSEIQGTLQRAKEIRRNAEIMTREYESRYIQGRL